MSLFDPKAAAKAAEFFARKPMQAEMEFAEFVPLEDECPAQLLAYARAQGLDAGNCPQFRDRSREGEFIRWVTRTAPEHRDLLVEEFMKEHARGRAERRARQQPLPDVD